MMMMMLWKKKKLALAVLVLAPELFESPSDSKLGLYLRCSASL